ncbi:Global transcription factor group E4, putative isoform 2 [Hibiscus syriacus]|uniref:Global transcription factor group E4, putative isoform 2 n=1 Tax=Hibiscus syriacus TaxID=106335 RepID=A0A6A2ZYI2_HIBSY|nr:Global transcription factor group E4, putative isoform 2 [Hibiscus syriacus]
MASGTVVGEGKDGENRERQRYMENKVYTRKAFKGPKKNNLLDITANNITTAKDGNNKNNIVNNKSNDINNEDNNNCSTAVNNSVVTTIVHNEENTNDENKSISDDKNNNNSAEAPAQALPLEHSDSAHQQPAPRLDTSVSGDSSSPQKQHVVAGNGAVKPSSENRLKIKLASRSKHEMRELRRKLESELDLVRNLVKRIEVKEAQISNSHVPVNDSVDYGFKRVQPEVTSVGITQEPVKHLRPLNQLNIPSLEISQGVSENMEKEKRTPKANQFYRNSEFLLAKDKLPSAESLGLHDYYTIIKHPMDLGAVKSRLNNNWYKSPREFAEDVRLTFRNAMTYNPKGQDVHIMAEQLSQIFEDKWAAIETDYIQDMRLAMEYEASLAMPTPRKAPPMLPPPLDMRRILDRPKSMMGPDLRPKVIAATPSKKEKLSTNLQSLPSEKLDNIVQIIKKRNSSLFQHDDEIEVDIDSVDTETLWELDRFITNYKKSLSKNKRKAELAIQARAKAEQTLQEKSPMPVLIEVAKEARINDQNMFTSTVELGKQGDNASRASSSSSSSSDSGSSSSDSDSESSSASKSDTGHSPRS